MTTVSPQSLAADTRVTAAARRMPAWLPLVLLTLFAGLLRFACLDRPELWYDEAATFHRVTSTYSDMLQILRTDGFVPLHYELYWLLARWFTLTPAVMRVVPATAGTLMVPAVYFLARQLVGRRVALLAAAFTTCSAWLMAFSHDAKMYMHFWLFVTLHVGCLLWWMRTGRRVAFWSAAAAGCAMAGLHATGLIVLGLDVVFFLAHPNTTWRRALPFAFLLALTVAGPAGYYTGFNRFAQSAAANWNLSGIQWVDWRNGGYSTPELLADTASAHLLAFTFIPEPTFASGPPQPPPAWATRTATTFLLAFAAFAFLGALPWPRRHPAAPDPAVLPAPISLFYLATWITLPAYILYCASTLDFASPLALLPTLAWPAIAIALAILLNFRPRTWRVILPLVGTFLLCCLVYLIMHGRTSPGSLWMPRYLGILFPALAIALCTLLARLPRPLAILAFTCLLGVNLTQSLARLTVSTEPPISLVARDVWASRDPAGPSRTYAQVRPGFGPPGAGTVTNNVGLYHLRLLSGQIVRPSEFRFISADRITPIRRYVDDPALIAWDVQQSPAVRAVTLWTEVDDSTADIESRLPTLLGPGWTLQSTRDYPVRVYWTWTPLYVYRRDVFAKR